ncbi:MAG: protein kinase [Myxococcales bacterium]|jgi:serine/threonine-protein kinase
MPAVSEDSRAGERLGRYKLLEVLSSSDTSEAYRATDESAGSTVRIEVLRPEFALHSKVVASFVDGPRSLSGLTHPNVSRVLAVESDDTGIPYVVQEHLEGQPLSEMLAAFPEGMALGVAMNVLLPVIDAVAAAHEAGIVHGALGTDRVLLANQAGTSVPKVVGFGHGGAGDEGPQAEGRTAPEVREGQAPNQRADVWAIGALLYETLTGQVPQGASGEREHVELEDLSPHLPTELTELVSRCLMRDAIARPRTAVELRDQLGALRRQMVGGARPAAAAAARPSPGGADGLPSMRPPPEFGARARDDESRPVEPPVKIEGLPSMRPPPVLGETPSGAPSEPPPMSQEEAFERAPLPPPAFDRAPTDPAAVMPPEPPPRPPKAAATPPAPPAPPADIALDASAPGAFEDPFAAQTDAQAAETVDDDELDAAFDETLAAEPDDDGPDEDNLDAAFGETFGAAPDGGADPALDDTLFGAKAATAQDGGAPEMPIEDDDDEPEMVVEDGDDEPEMVVEGDEVAEASGGDPDATRPDPDATRPDPDATGAEPEAPVEVKSLDALANAFGPLEGADRIGQGESDDHRRARAARNESEEQKDETAAGRAAFLAQGDKARQEDARRKARHEELKRERETRQRNQTGGGLTTKSALTAEQLARMRASQKKDESPVMRILGGLLFLIFVVTLLFAVPLLTDETGERARELLGERVKLAGVGFTVLSVIALVRMWSLQLRANPPMIKPVNTIMKIMTGCIVALVVCLFFPRGSLGPVETAARAGLPWLTSGFYLFLALYGFGSVLRQASVNVVMAGVMALMYSGALFGSYRVAMQAMYAQFDARRIADADDDEDDEDDEDDDDRGDEEDSERAFLDDVEMEDLSPEEIAKRMRTEGHDPNKGKKVRSRQLAGANGDDDVAAIEDMRNQRKGTAKQMDKLKKQMEKLR